MSRQKATYENTIAVNADPHSAAVATHDLSPQVPLNEFPWLTLPPVPTMPAILHGTWWRVTILTEGGSYLRLSRRAQRKAA